MGGSEPGKHGADPSNVHGKIKGGGTSGCRKAGLHVGRCGTRLLRRCAVCGAKVAPAWIERRASPAALGGAALEVMP